MAETKPTPSEIERAKAALCHPEHPMVERVAQALADTRERCAVIAEPKMDAILLACGEMTAGERRTVTAVLKWIAAAIRKGEP